MIKFNRLILPTQFLTPPHSVSRPEQVIELFKYFIKFGWNNFKPDLVGYWYGNTIQLLIGSHRYEAARLADIPVPVKVYKYRFIWEAWGNLDEWRKIINGTS